MVEFGGLLGYAPIMPVNQFSCDAFVQRGGRIPAPIHSFKTDKKARNFGKGEFLAFLCLRGTRGGNILSGVRVSEPKIF